MPPLPPHDALDQIQALLNQGAPPLRLIADLRPRTRAEAIAWARRLTAWDEERGRYPDQAVALTRLISRHALRAFGLTVSEDGRVIERPAEAGWSAPPQSFSLAVRDQEVRVEYTPAYSPASGRDHFAFLSPHDPPQPHALSASGHWSHFAAHDAVEACGGPHAYAALYAEARRRGEDQAFSAAFEGAPPQSKQPRRQKAPPPAAPPRPPAVLGVHTAEVVEERASDPFPKPPAHQRRLF
jgi:hypothetical protein